LYGGSSRDQEITDIYVLDLARFNWQVIKPHPKDGDSRNSPGSRDEHTNVVHDNNMVVFGGFSKGEKTNEVFRYCFKDNTWQKIIPATAT
jgi:N-acetylneuraminic acid mutarotase